MFVRQHFLFTVTLMIKRKKGNKNLFHFFFCLSHGLVEYDSLFYIVFFFSDMMNNMGSSYQGQMGQDSGGVIYPGMPANGGSHPQQQSMMGHQQYPRQYDQYSMSKADHGQAMMMGGQSLPQPPQQQHVQNQVGPFSPPMAGNIMPQQQQGGMYSAGYGMGPQGIHPQQQQMSPMVSPNVGWNQQQTSPTQPVQPYMGGPQGPGGGYMAAQSYHNHQQQQQMAQRSQYTPSTPYMGSQSAMQTGMASPSTSMGGLIGSPMQGHSGSYPTVSQNQNPMMQPGFNSQINQNIPHVSQYQANDMMSAHAPPSQMGSGGHQHYPPYSSSQQQAHFANPTAGAGNGAYCPPSYPGMQPRMPNTTTTPSPLPTPPPSQQQSMISNSHSGTTNTSSQSGYGTSSLQQLEQLVSPSLAPGTNPYQQIMQQGSSSPVGVGAGISGSSSGNVQQGPIYSSPNFPTTTTVASTLSMAGATQAGSGGMMTQSQAQQHIQGQQNMTSMHTKGNAIGYQNQLTSGVPHPGPLSPSQSSMLNPPQSKGLHPQQQMEAQRLEQQLQQLMNMPKTPQVSQQIMEVQERLHIMRSQSQLHMQQQQPQIGQPSPTQMPQQQVRMRMQHQQQQMALSQQSMRPMRAGPPMHRMAGMNNQPLHLQQQQQQQHQPSYSVLNGPGTLFPGQASAQQLSPATAPNQFKANQSIPSPQKVQPFQVSFACFFFFLFICIET